MKVVKMKLIETLNEKVGKIPYVGKALTKEISVKDAVVAAGVTAIAGYMALVNAVSTLAVDGSVEIVSGVDNENYALTTIDAKLGGEIADRTNFFLRNRTTMDHDNMVDSFTLIDLSYNLGKGLDAVGEMQFVPGAETDYRLGMQYFHKFKKGVTAYALLTRNFTEEPNTELTTVLGYSRDIKGEWKLVGRVEGIINMADTCYNYDLTRLRLGIGKGRFLIGPAADISGLGSGEEPAYTAGGFVAVKF
ncbi:hypothetical protein ACFL6I_17115 [candidate division KSB1 bacterium]